MVETMLNRIPAGTSAGRRRVIEMVFSAGLEVRAKTDAAAKDKNRTPTGNANEVLGPFLKKTGAAELRKARRFVEYSKTELDRERGIVRKKAIGEPKATDALWLDRLFKMSPTERVAFFLQNPAARAAALREPELAGFHPTDFPQVEPAQVKSWVEQGLQRTIRETNEKGAARIQIIEQAHELLQIGVGELEKALCDVPAIGDSTGGASKFTGTPHLEAWLNAHAPGEVGAASLHEQAVFDAVED